MDSIRIVFTGGPCAGKTTLINKVKEYLLSKKFKVLVVPETATNLQNMGVNIKLSKSVTTFQNFIMKKQLTNESIIDEILKLNSDEKFIILYDRGVLDNKAYCDNSEQFNAILNNYGGGEINYLDKYDIVFDLITVADCAPHKYTCENNKNRKESIEEAKVLDKKTSAAWVGHRNLKIINSSISIDEAFNILKNEINDLIKSQSQTKIEKFNIDNSINDFNCYNDNNSRLIKIQEVNLNIENKDIRYVLYKRTYKKDISYIFKVFEEKNGFIKTYYDSKISFDKYLELIEKYKIKDINFYQQLSFIEKRQLYNIKFYADRTILEYEENKLNEKLCLPSIIKLPNLENKTLKKELKNDTIK